MERIRVVTGLLLFLAGCHGAARVELSAMDGSMARLRENFNADRDRLRVVALLSPV